MSKEKEEKTTENWLKEVQKGYIRMGVLILLNKKPAHGYEIMKEINSRTQGFWQPTAGGVYPILRDLEKSGYIKGQWQTQKNRRLKVYKITKSGELILRRAIIRQSEIFNNVGNLFREFASEVLNVETIENPLTHMPLPFTPFLEDNTNNRGNLKELEHERQRANDHLKSMQERIRQIDKRIREIKKQSSGQPPQTPG
jgi:DNA-binding PadR family transcriptional regulator